MCAGCSTERRKWRLYEKIFERRLTSYEFNISVTENGNSARKTCSSDVRLIIPFLEGPDLSYHLNTFFQGFKFRRDSSSLILRQYLWLFQCAFVAWCQECQIHWLASEAQLRLCKSSEKMFPQYDESSKYSMGFLPREINQRSSKLSWSTYCLISFLLQLNVRWVKQIFANGEN